MEGNVVVPGGQCRASVRVGGRAGILEEQGSMATDGSLEAGKGKVQPREARWASTAVIPPQGGLSEHLRVSSALFKTKTKKSKKKTQKHS